MQALYKAEQERPAGFGEGEESLKLDFKGVQMKFPSNAKETPR